MKKLLIWAIFGLTSTQAKVLLTEELLMKESLKDTPQMDQIEAALLGTQVQRAQFMEQFDFNGYGGINHMQTRKKRINSFNIIQTPITQAQIGVQKKFHSGLTTKVDISTYQNSSKGNQFIPTVNKATTTVVSFTAQMDIWKDLFGKLSEKQVDNLNTMEAQSKLQRKINKKAFQISLRKIYWSLVANNETLKIYRSLLKTANKQLEESKERLKSRVTEKDEVLRYAAQKASRASSLEYMKFQQQALLKQLRQMIPNFNNTDVELAKYNLENTINEVLACTTIIVKYQQVPYQNTDYDELVKMILGMQENYKVINERHDDPSVNLYGTLNSTGVGATQTGNKVNGSIPNSFKDMSGHNRTGFEVGVNVKVALGNTQKTTKEYLQEYDQKRLEATLKNTQTNMIATHNELAHSTQYLVSVIKSSKINASNLAQRMKYMKKKFKQARATVSDLIADEDAYISAQLSTIQAQLEIVNVVLNYLTIYSDTPCTFNQKI